MSKRGSAVIENSKINHKRFDEPVWREETIKLDGNISPAETLIDYFCVFHLSFFKLIGMSQ